MGAGQAACAASLDRRCDLLLFCGNEHEGGDAEPFLRAPLLAHWGSWDARCTRLPLSMDSALAETQLLRTRTRECTHHLAADACEPRQHSSPAPARAAPPAVGAKVAGRAPLAGFAFLSYPLLDPAPPPPKQKAGATPPADSSARSLGRG